MRGCEIWLYVSIPKRVSEVLWLSGALDDEPIIVIDSFQSLKGFQRFCGKSKFLRAIWKRLPIVSIPKRVSEVLWPVSFTW